MMLKDLSKTVHKFVWFLYVFSNQTFTVHITEYSAPPKTGLSSIQMVIFWTLFKSGFRMALAAILLKPFKNRTKKSGFRMVGHLFTI